MSRAGVFLDRDGVLIRDLNNLTRVEQVDLISGSAAAVRRLCHTGFPVIVVTNQAVVARGWTTEREVEQIHEYLRRLLHAQGAQVTAFYFCPHHPNANLAEYRTNCECRKPRPGMLLQAAEELGLDLARSYMVGDRITDILAGHAANCTTILVESGRHTAPPIETVDPIDRNVGEDCRCRDLAAATEWILQQECVRQ